MRGEGHRRSPHESQTRSQDSSLDIENGSTLLQRNVLVTSASKWSKGIAILGALTCFYFVLTVIVGPNTRQETPSSLIETHSLRTDDKDDSNELTVNYEADALTKVKKNTEVIEDTEELEENEDAEDEDTKKLEDFDGSDSFEDGESTDNLEVGEYQSINPATRDIAEEVKSNSKDSDTNKDNPSVKELRTSREATKIENIKKPAWMGSGKGDRPDLVEKRNLVKESFKFAWRGYTKFAFGQDEISPVTNRSSNTWGGYAITLVDSLDTMILMGLEEELKEAREHVETLTFTNRYDVSFFETTIRHLGGLLAAYELTRDELYLNKAILLGDRLLFAFQGRDIPYSIVNLKTGQAFSIGWTNDCSILAEIGTIQLEFGYLSHVSGNPIYQKKADKIISVLNKATRPRKGLFPILFHPHKKYFDSFTISFGTLGDSFYEYLLKRWIWGGKREDLFRNMYDQSIYDMKELMLSHFDVHYDEKTKSFLYVSELAMGLVSIRTEVTDHLACFVPGMLALGATNDEDIEIAKRLLSTCIALYKMTRTGLGPEKVVFSNSERYNPANLSSYWGSPNDWEHEEWALKMLKEGLAIDSPAYLLRPETVESLFVLFRVTKDEFYRKVGWEIFQSIEKYCKTPVAYSGIRNVFRKTPKKDDVMQSFFLAETLKYLYLLFSPEDFVSLDDYVFNTEAHPLGIIDRIKIK